MRLYEVQVNIDNKSGLGAVPMNQEVDYHGIRVLMKPSTFLRLASKVENPDLTFIQNEIKNGKAIGSPFLDIRLPEEWSNNNFKKSAKIVGHEGRHRMLAIKNLYGDVPIEVHLFFRDGIRNRHLTPEIIEQLNIRLIPQSETRPISGPFFKVK